MGSPVSWYAIAPGWAVTTLDRAKVGVVDEVLGDEELDIFHGLAVGLGIGKIPRRVPSELVCDIRGGVVTIELLADEIGTLPNVER
jgi:hypothetical protein